MFTRCSISWVGTKPESESVKEGVREIPGKTISAVVVGNGDRHPKIQVILVFEDGTSLEFYGADFNCASGLDGQGLDAAVDYVEKMGNSVVVYTVDGAERKS